MHNLTVTTRTGEIDTYSYSSDRLAIAAWCEELKWESTLYATVSNMRGQIIKEDFGDFVTQREAERYNETCLGR